MLDAGLKAALQKKYSLDQVLIVPYASASVVQDKFRATPIKKAKGMLDDRRFVFRSDAEYNQALVQLIPYIVVVSKRMDKVYVTERIAGDERLKDTLALGAAGHIDPVDTENAPSAWSIILNAADRELNEELDIKLVKGTGLEYAGTVRDLQSPTSEHLGIVYLVYASSVKVKETENLRGRWMRFTDLVNSYHKFESWARYIMDHMLEAGSSNKKIKL